MYTPTFLNHSINSTGIGADPETVTLTLLNPRPFLINFFSTPESTGILSKVSNLF